MKSKFVSKHVPTSGRTPVPYRFSGDGLGIGKQGGVPLPTPVVCRAPIGGKGKPE